MDILTKKSTRQVALRPLDNSGRAFVLFGLTAERMQFNDGANARRAVDQRQVTQQRSVGPRRFTISISVFEPSLRDDGAPTRLDRGAIYEEGGMSKRLQAREQLDLVHDLAKMEEEGILFSYSGISMSLERAAILDFNADLVYATGTGTLTIEERPAPVLDIESIAVSVEAASNAIKELEAAGEDELAAGDAIIDLFSTDDTNVREYTLTILAFQAEVLEETNSLPLVPTTDPAVLAKHGLSFTPVSFQTDDGVLSLFPRDPAYRKPKLRILPLGSPARTAAGFKDYPAPFRLSVTAQGLFIDFQFRPQASGHPRPWEVTTWVFDQPIPLYEIREEDAPIVDPKVDVGRLPAAQAPDPRSIAFRPENRGRFKDLPRHVRTHNVEFGIENDLADQLTFAFMPANESKWTRPRGTAIREWALVLADYRETAS